MVTTAISTMTTISTNRKQPSLETVRKLRRQTIAQKRLLKAGYAIVYEQGQKIEGDRITILAQTSVLAQISDANELKVLRLKMAILLRRQLEKRLWDAVLELLAYEERERSRGYGYTHPEMASVLNIKAMFE
jgi:hypothetical protein